MNPGYFTLKLRKEILSYTAKFTQMVECNASFKYIAHNITQPCNSAICHLVNNILVTREFHIVVYQSFCQNDVHTIPSPIALVWTEILFHINPALPLMHLSLNQDLVPSVKL